MATTITQTRTRAQLTSVLKKNGFKKGVGTLDSKRFFKRSDKLTVCVEVGEDFWAAHTNWVVTDVRLTTEQFNETDVNIVKSEVSLNRQESLELAALLQFLTDLRG